MKEEVCFLAVDVQRGFETPESAPVFKAIAQRMADYAYVIASRFGNVEGSPLWRYKGFQGVRRGSPDSELLLDPAGRDSDHWHVVEKSLFSGFDAGAADWARARGITEIHLCGGDSDLCLLATALDVHSAGLRPVILWDLCFTSGGPDRHAAALVTLKRFFGKKQLKGAGPGGQ